VFPTLSSLWRSICEESGVVRRNELKASKLLIDERVCNRDIAGTAWMEEQKPWIAKRPSGMLCVVFVEFVKSFPIT